MKTTELLQIAAAVLLSLGGGGAIVVALSSWLGKLWADRLLERQRAVNERQLEAYKRELELSFDSKKRASEAEFKIYRQLWAAVTKLTHAGLSIRSGVTKSTLGEQDHFQRYREFQSALGEFELSYQSHRPFYAHAVYESIALLERCVSLENKTAIAHRDLEGIDLGASRMQSVTRITEASEAVCKAIQDRLYPRRVASSEADVFNPGVEAAR
jgi:hypothetical protein